MMVRRSALCLGAALIALASCAPKPQAPTGPLRVVVGSFTADPAIVTLDPTVRRSADATEADDVAAGAVETLVATLAYRLQQSGISAQRLPAGAAPGANDTLLSGHLDRIDEGNRTERATGGGRPVVTGTLVISRTGADGKTDTIATVTGDSSAADVPGIRGGAAASAAALAGGGERARQLLIAGVQAEARRLANVFADQARPVLVDRHLVPPRS